MIVLISDAKYMYIFRCKVWEDQNCDSSPGERLPYVQTWQPASPQLVQGAFPQPRWAAFHPGVTSGLMSLSAVVVLFLAYFWRQLHRLQ